MTHSNLGLFGAASTWRTRLYRVSQNRRLNPSVGLPGGEITRLWVEMCGPKVTLVALSAWLEESHNAENPDTILEFQMGDDAFRKFQGWLVQTGSVFDKNWKSLKMRMTCVAKYFGLSRSGIQFFSSLGWLSPLTNVDRTSREAVPATLEKIG